MLLRRDIHIDLGPVARAADEAYRSEKDWGALELPDLENVWLGQSRALEPIAAALEHWEERELAAKTRKTIENLAKLAKELTGEMAPEAYFSRALALNHELVELRIELECSCPLPDELPVDSQEPAEDRMDIAIALIVGRRPAQHPRLWRVVRTQLAALGALRLTPYEPKASTRRICDFRRAAHRAGARSEKRHLVSPNPRDYRRLLDELGQDLLPLADERYAIGYFLVPQATQSRSLEGLLRLAWALSSMSSNGAPGSSNSLAFWMCACPAEVSRASQLRVVDQDAMFDHLSHLVRDDTFRNCVAVHPRLVDTKSKLRQWFTPAWRVPFQHRLETKSQHEWLWTTGRLTGLPGEEIPTELMYTRQDLSAAYWPRHQNGTFKTPVPPARRCTTRLLLRRNIHCSLQFDGRVRQAVLLDYSPFGCRVRLPPCDDANEAELNPFIESCYTLEFPSGLPWPWQRGRHDVLQQAIVKPIPPAADGAPRRELDQALVRPPGIEVSYQFVVPEGRPT